MIFPPCSPDFPAVGPPTSNILVCSSWSPLPLGELRGPSFVKAPGVDKFLFSQRFCSQLLTQTVACNQVREWLPEAGRQGVMQSVRVTQVYNTLHFPQENMSGTEEETNGIDAQPQDQGDREWWGLWQTAYPSEVAAASSATSCHGGMQVQDCQILPLPMGRQHPVSFSHMKFPNF